MTTGFTLSDIAYGEALVRVSSHLDNALEVYRSAEAGAALLHANRSLELMPQITRDLWRYGELATALNQAAASVASSIRSRRPATEVAAGRDAFDELSARAVAAVVGDPAASPAYRASVVVALLRTAVAAAEAGFGADARAIALRARALAGSLWGGAILPEVLEVAFEDLVALLEGEASGEEDAVRVRVTTIVRLLHDQHDAVLDTEPSAREALERVARLLNDATEAAAAGDLFRADKLVARAYVEAYNPLRQKLASWEHETETDDLVGSRIRRALAAGEPIDDLVERARNLLASAPL